ncbi:MAG TPA: M56 family metallopeptidase [Sphingomonas sp.]|nr:M56 family metallopeptidase [Sphingomonas sp.]
MIPWLVQTLIAATFLMALVLLLRAPVTRAFGPRAAYALWLLPALRMILPPLPGWRAMYIPVFWIQPHHSTVGLVDPATAVHLLASTPADAATISAEAVTPMPILHPAPAPTAAHDWGLLLIALWLGVAALWFGWQMWRYNRFLARALRGAVPLATIKGVSVLMSEGVRGPAATGIWKRRILLPADFLTRYTPEERRLALLHEGAHHDRFDILANLAALAVTALHWWNPLAHHAYRYFREDQELACDATVLADCGAPERALYGRALLKSAVASTPSVACALNPKSRIKQRIAMMTRKPMGRLRLLAGGALAFAMIGGGMMMTASGVEAQPVAPVAPQPPLPPEAPAAPDAAVPPPAPLPPMPPMPPVSGDNIHIRHHLTPAERRRIERDVHRATAEARRSARDAVAQAHVAEHAATAAQARIARMDIPRMVQASLNQARADLAVQCAASGTPMPATADWGKLATCGPGMRKEIQASLAGARASIRAARDLSEAQRAEAMRGLDQALDRMDRDLSTM